MVNQQSNAREMAVMPPLPAAGVGSEATRVEQARAVAEVAAAVQVAQMYPRDQRLAWHAMQDACARTGLAERAFYSVPNRGHGPSVHLARELARIWGNMDYGVRETHRDDDLGRSEVLAFAWDQQTNSRTSRSFLVPHARMVKKQRTVLTDLGDIHLNNTNQGARALRECIFAIMPADFVAEAQEICRHTLTNGDGKPLQQRIANLVHGFAGLGVDVPRIEQKIGRSRGQWTPSDVADLTIVGGTLKRGEMTAEEAFPPVLTLDQVTASAGPQRLGEAQPAPVPRRTPPDPDDKDLHLMDDQQAMRVLATMGQQVDPGKGHTKPITEFCGYVTPDGACNLPAGHPTGPELEGYDGHDFIPQVNG
jgi:hypothetical protein